MGGRTKDIKPVAVRLDSGDLFGMCCVYGSYGGRIEEMLSWSAKGSGGHVQGRGTTWKEGWGGGQLVEE